MSPTVLLVHGDARALPLAENTVDAIVTDPPYGLGFMGKAWDTFYIQKRTDQRDGSGPTPQRVASGRSKSTGMGAAASAGGQYDRTLQGQHAFQSWCEEWAREALRVLKPGGHLITFGGTRTWHRLGCALEDAGFEIRDTALWLYGEGFPKSLNVSKAIDKAAGAERLVIGTERMKRMASPIGRPNSGYGLRQQQIMFEHTEAATQEARRWDGWGTGLKPGWEPIILARKPLSEPNVAANVLRWGTGAINVDGCRIPAESGVNLGGGAEKWTRHTGGWHRPWMDDPEHQAQKAQTTRENVARAEVLGRWPANVILDPDSAGALDEQAGERKAGGSPPRRFSDKTRNAFGEFKGHECPPGIGSSTGGPSRFFYCAKASPNERGEGNDHPTVKPLALMVYLCRLIVPPGGLVLDPLCGSGSTLLAAGKLGLSAIGLDIEWDYLLMAKRRGAQAAML